MVGLSRGAGRCRTGRFKNAGRAPSAVGDVGDVAEASERAGDVGAVELVLELFDGDDCTESAS